MSAESAGWEALCAEQPVDDIRGVVAECEASGNNKGGIIMSYFLDIAVGIVRAFGVGDLILLIYFLCICLMLKKLQKIIDENNLRKRSLTIKFELKFRSRK
jgi:hypothetical protein